jgi:hypothetical protein
MRAGSNPFPVKGVAELETEAGSEVSGERARALTTTVFVRCPNQPAPAPTPSAVTAPVSAAATRVRTRAVRDTGAL